MAQFRVIIDSGGAHSSLFFGNKKDDLVVTVDGQDVGCRIVLSHTAKGVDKLEIYETGGIQYDTGEKLIASYN